MYLFSIFLLLLLSSSFQPSLFNPSLALTHIQRNMEASLMATTAICAVIVIVVIWGWSVLNWLWLRPKRMEKVLREQGFQGNSYRFLVGDTKLMFTMHKEANSKPMSLSDNIAPRVLSFEHQTVNNYGKNSFIWVGPIPRVLITDPAQIKDVSNKIYDFPKPEIDPFALVFQGLVSHEGEKWAKHRKILNPAFNLQKLKIMFSTFVQSCSEKMSTWEAMLSSDGSRELDIYPLLQSLTLDVISRTAFGGSHEEGRRVFELVKDQSELYMKIQQTIYIPGWWYLPTATHRRFRAIEREIRTSLQAMIDKREKATKAGEAAKDDLLGILLDSNHKKIEGHGNNKSVGMSHQDVIEECKIFYVAGQETTSVLLAWTILLLSKHPHWQARAREEVFQVFGNKQPVFDGLSDLKIVTMILYEVLRLYPPVIMLNRTPHRDMKLGNLSIPEGVELSLQLLMVHHDSETWGDDAKEFNPERFSEGVSKATKNGQVAFFPFGWGPRICIGQNFALVEAKMALSMILQRFSFELSPSHTHGPIYIITLQPEYGVHVILHKL